MGTAQELERVRRELRDVTMPAKLAAFADGRAVLYDDRVEIDRFAIALVPGAVLTDVVVTGSGRSGVVYLSVSGPDGSRSLRLKSDQEAGAREFASAVRDAAERVHDVQAERDRRIQELGTRVAELTAEPRRPEREPVLVGDVVPGQREVADPLIDDVPDPEDWPSRAERAAARAAGVVGAGGDEVHVVTDVPNPFVEEAAAGTVAEPRAPKAAKPPEVGRGRRARRTKAAKSPKPPKPPKPPRNPRELRKPVAALLGVLLVVGGTVVATKVLRDRDMPDLSAPTSPAPAPKDPAPEKPQKPQEPEVEETGDSPIAKATAALRKRLGRGDVDVLDVEVDGGTLVIDVRQADPGSMMRQTGEVFADVHASGINPKTAVLQHYGMVRDPVTGQSELGVVGVYKMSRKQSKGVNWAAWGDISWDSFLTYRSDDWP